MSNPLAQFRHRPRFGVGSASIHDIAKALGIHYSGDINLEHGGMFYDVADWLANDYANAVSVSVDDGHVFISSGAINRVDDLASVLRVYGWSIDDESGDIVSEHSGDIIAAKDSPAFLLLEIEATHSTWGIEPETDRTCKLVEIYRLRGEHSENCSDYFIDQGKRVKMDDLQGYVLSQYVLPHLAIDEGGKA